MKRGAFLKSLAALVAAPVAIAKAVGSAPVAGRTIDQVTAYIASPTPGKYKAYVSSIGFLDKREILGSWVEKEDVSFTDIMQKLGGGWRKTSGGISYRKKQSYYHG